MNSIHPLRRTRVWRTYSGGARLEEFFGNGEGVDGHFPEEWILSAVAARNPGRPPEGLSMLRDLDISFRELLESDPGRLLGGAHAARFGASPGVLVKLIDAAERLTIQVHPDRRLARELFNSPFGKTECWHMLEGRQIKGERPCIHLGFKPGITRERWVELFERQDIPAMLDCLHRFEVEPGDTFLIAGGLPHAIGAGCFLVEIQEAADLTLRTERVTPAGLAIPDEACHQGIGFERMFDCFRYDGMTRGEVERHWRIARDGDSLISFERSECFEMRRKAFEGGLELAVEGGFMGIFVLEGNGVVSSRGESCRISKGDQLFVAASAGNLVFTALPNMDILYFRGPR